MEYQNIVTKITNLLYEYDSEKPVHKEFQPGIGPFGEPQIVKIIAEKLTLSGLDSLTKRTPDLLIQNRWGIEFKIVRPFGDNGKEAENWSVNMLHPYPGNVSLLSDAIKLRNFNGGIEKGLFVIGYEHNPARISLDPLIDSFELIARKVLLLNLSDRIEETRKGLVHPEHQVLRCIGWKVL